MPVNLRSDTVHIIGLSEIGGNLSAKKKPIPYFSLTVHAIFIATAITTTAVSSCYADSPSNNDPFSDLTPLPSPKSTSTRVDPWWNRDTQFRRELFLQTALRDTSKSSSSSRLYNRHSVGFESFRRFQGETSTIATCDLQMRAVRRDDYLPVIQDMEGADRTPWAVEYHNAYCDIFNPASYLLDEEDSAELVGKVNARIGRFYLPLGLNLATDTHGTVLQLSNDQNVGFERDWYTGFWGALTPSISYDAYYMAGSGYDLRFDGQSGMFGFRLGTGPDLRNRSRLEAGVSTLIGERLAPSHQSIGEVDGQKESPENGVIATRRIGPDLRYTIPTEIGSFIVTNEASFGSDDGNDTAIHLHQLGYLDSARKFGTNIQFRQQWLKKNQLIANDHHHHGNVPQITETTDSISRSLFYDFSYYLTNDIANANLHWINISVEQILESALRGSGTIVSLQYYRYW